MIRYSPETGRRVNIAFVRRCARHNGVEMGTGFFDEIGTRCVSPATKRASGGSHHGIPDARILVYCSTDTLGSTTRSSLQHSPFRSSECVACDLRSHSITPTRLRSTFRQQPSQLLEATTTIMANTTQPWLEDLSEEWIPQPTPDTLAQKTENPTATQITQNAQAKTRSRLPRMRQSSGSFSEIQVRSIANELRPPKQRSALAERSLSDNNVPATASPNASRLEHSRSASYSFSSELDDSAMLNGTVAHNIAAKSPAKENRPQDTPEWRRRLVNGELAYGDQKDLFGPTGLENIFQKPSSSVENTQQPKCRVGVLKGLAAMRSSPPPWPTVQQDPASSEQEDQYPEAEGEDSQVRSYHSRPDESAQEQEKSFSSQPPSNSNPNQETSRTASGQIEFENENFSPVYLTTNLKIGQLPGAIPNFRGSELANRLRQIGSPPPTVYQHVPEDISLSQGREDSSFSRLRDDSLPDGLPAGTPDLADVGRFVEIRRGGYSRDGSFRRRPLSPSPERTARSSASRGDKARGEMKPHSLQVFTAVEVKDPKTPHRQDNKQYLSPERAKNSGSPLKLFDAHDTFTSNRIQRRLSQLEYKSDKTTSSVAKESRVPTSKSGPKSRLTSVAETSFQHAAEDPFRDDHHPSGRRAGTFGEGELSKYQFSGEFSVASNRDFDEDDDSAPDGSPSMDIAPPGSRASLSSLFSTIHQSLKNKSKRERRHSTVFRVHLDLRIDRSFKSTASHPGTKSNSTQETRSRLCRREERTGLACQESNA